MSHIYQLYIELKGSQPPIWRRLQVNEGISFSELHDVIQLSMGWEDAHMYEFLVNGVRIFDFEEDIDDGTDPTERDSMNTFLNDLVVLTKSRFTYIYDYGDHWEHEIKVEKMLPKDESKAYPLCLEGERACPPEGCGGISGYQEILEVLADKDHSKYDEIIEWIGDDWHPEAFDCNKTNVLLQNYIEEWNEIYQETEELEYARELEEEILEEFGLDDELDENSEYEHLKDLSCPQDVLKEDFLPLAMKDWLMTKMEEPDSIEFRTLERLRNLGLDDEKILDLLMDALSIEWFYSLKYDIDKNMQGRYENNLNHLPEPPRELHSLQDALIVLNHCQKGVPFAAIEYLQSDSSKEATSTVINGLKEYNAKRNEYTFSPFWYALAAEGHICKELVDPVIQLYTGNDINNSDWILDQGQFLIGKLAEKYPDYTVQQVLDAMDKDEGNKFLSTIFYLFDVFWFCDIEKYKSRLVAFLKQDDLPWFVMLTATVADLNIKEALPVLKSKYKKLKAETDDEAEGLFWNPLIEIEEAIAILEGKIVPDLQTCMPLSLKRKISWQDDLKAMEYAFYEEDTYTNEPDFSHLIDEELNDPLFTRSMSHQKEKLPGRNEPCHCGSGKKYKKCCMDDDLSGL